MKNVTTHETSLRLKAAGFPQPQPEVGQFWYDDSGVLVCIGFSYDPGGSIARFKQAFAFAPTAADILQYLSIQYPVRYNGLEYEVEPDVYPEELFTDENMAEACAAAWLELKKQVAKSG